MTNPSSNASNPSDELTQPTIRHHFVVIPAATPENWMPRRAGSQQVPAPHTSTHSKWSSVIIHGHPKSSYVDVHSPGNVHASHE